MWHAVASTPRTVVAASALLILAAAAITLQSAIGLAHARAVTEAFQTAYAGVEGVSFSILSIRTTAAILLVVAGGLVLLAVFNLRGSTTARLNTWILGAVLLCWGGYSLAVDPGPPANAPDPAELERLLAAAVPGWVEPVTAAAQAVVLASVLAAMVLLALPPARRHFADQSPPVQAA